jgi:hypothetical protein
MRRGVAHVGAAACFARFIALCLCHTDTRHRRAGTVLCCPPTTWSERGREIAKEKGMERGREGGREEEREGVRLRGLAGKGVSVRPGVV